MDDEDYDKLCEICFENFDKFERIPKTLDCCKKTYCEKCLIYIYLKKYPCSNCKALNGKEPKNLPTNSSIFESKKPKCPNCKKETNVNNLFVKIDENPNKKVFIYCLKCWDDNENNQYFENFSESSFFQFGNEKTNLCNFNSFLRFELKLFEDEKFPSYKSFNFDNKGSNKKTEDDLNSKILKFVDNFFEKFKKNLKLKIKQYMIDYLLEEKGYRFEMEKDLYYVTSDLERNFKNNFNKFLSISEINSQNITVINDAIALFIKIKSIEDKYEKTLSAKDFIKSLVFDFGITDKENFENFMINNLEIKSYGSLVFSNIDKFFSSDNEGELTTGIDLIDLEFQKLKSNSQKHSDDLKNYMKKNEELSNQLTFNEKKFKDLNNELKKSQLENNQLRENLNKLEQKIADIVLKNSNNNGKINELYKIISQKDDEIKEKENNLIDIKKENKGLYEKLSLIVNKNKQLEEVLKKNPNLPKDSLLENIPLNIKDKLNNKKNEMNKIDDNFLLIFNDEFNISKDNSKITQSTDEKTKSYNYDPCLFQPAYGRSNNVKENIEDFNDSFNQIFVRDNFKMKNDDFNHFKSLEFPKKPDCSYGDNKTSNYIDEFFLFNKSVNPDDFSETRKNFDSTENLNKNNNFYNPYPVFK